MPDTRLRRNIREILNGLVQDCQDMDTNIDIVNICITQSVEGILALLQATEEVKECDLIERTAQCIAHRACCGSEHNPQEGKLHGYCVVCGVPWPCEYVGEKPRSSSCQK